MNTRGSVAKKVRLFKQERPELFCVVPGCLYMTRTKTGESPCPKHPRPMTLEQKLERSVAMAEMQKTASPVTS